MIYETNVNYSPQGNSYDVTCLLLTCWFSRFDHAQPTCDKKYFYKIAQLTFFRCIYVLLCWCYLSIVTYLHICFISHVDAHGPPNHFIHSFVQTYSPEREFTGYWYHG